MNKRKLSIPVLILTLMIASSCAKEEVGKSAFDKGLDYAQHEMFEQAAAEFSKALSERPGDALVHYNHGVTLLQLGKADAAEAAFRKVILLDTKHAQALNNLGVIKHAAANFTEASSFFRQSIASDASLVDAHANLGLTLRAAGNRDESIEAYRELLKLEPGNERAHDGLKKLGVDSSG